MKTKKNSDAFSVKVVGGIDRVIKKKKKKGVVREGFLEEVALGLMLEGSVGVC